MIIMSDEMAEVVFSGLPKDQQQDFMRLNAYAREELKKLPKTPPGLYEYTQEEMLKSISDGMENKNV